MRVTFSRSSVRRVRLSPAAQQRQAKRAAYMDTIAAQLDWIQQADADELNLWELTAESMHRKKAHRFYAGARYLTLAVAVRREALR